MVETTFLKSSVEPWNDTNLNHAGEGALPWIYVFESLGTGQTPRKHSLNEEKRSQTVQVCFRPRSEHVSLLSYPPVDSHWNMSSALMNYKSVKYFSPAARGDCSLTWQRGRVQAGTRGRGSRGNGAMCGSTRGSRAVPLGLVSAALGRGEPPAAGQEEERPGGSAGPGAAFPTFLLLGCMGRLVPRTHRLWALPLACASGSHELFLAKARGTLLMLNWCK